MRILFLDDNPARTRWAVHNLGPGNTLHTCETAPGAITLLEAFAPYDLVHLDHDLTEETFVDSSRTDCGMEVVRWIIRNKPEIKRIIVHTMNTPAGHEMVRTLRFHGYDAKYQSFYRIAHEGV